MLQQRLCLGFGRFRLATDGKRALLTAVAADSPVLTVNNKKVLLEMDSQKPPQGRGH